MFAEQKERERRGWRWGEGGVGNLDVSPNVGGFFIVVGKLPFGREVGVHNNRKNKIIVIIAHNMNTLVKRVGGLGEGPLITAGYKPPPHPPPSP